MIVPRSRQLRSFLLSLIVVSTLSAKAVHLLLHSHSVPRYAFVLYFATFFIVDIFLFVGSWSILHRTSGAWGPVGLFIGGLLGAVNLAAASSQIGFFYVTGAEVRWGTATSVASDPAAFKLLLSGLRPVCLSGVSIVILAWLLTPFISTWLDRWLAALCDFNPADVSGGYLPLVESKQPYSKDQSVRKWTVSVVILVVCLRLIRPSLPYDHMSGTIPFTLSTALRSKSKTCPQAEAQPFPLISLTDSQFWELPYGHFKGWMPGMQDLSDEDIVEQRSWFPKAWPPGFGRWAKRHVEQSESVPVNATAHKGGKNSTCPGTDAIHSTYNPTTDPMRITNLNEDLLAPLQEALRDHDVPLSHIILIEMESARKDVFPFKSGSHLHEMIIESHESSDPGFIDELNRRLSAVSPIAEQLTGESSNFPRTSNQYLPADIWRDQSAPGMGGINVMGAITGSTLSFKSFLGSHCGVGALPVDFMYENEADIYQPCIPHILGLFNQLKEDSAEDTEDFRQRKWKSVFMQSITGEYEDQNVLNRKIGFRESIVREDIENPTASKYWHSSMEEINYFGYAEHELLPYLKDTIHDAIENKERLFLSHFTSATHHPWGVPSEFQTEQYWSGDGLYSKHRDANKFLNAVRYVDKWLGDILTVLDETGIANETLVVIVGDHGQAFTEDSEMSGTYDNPHISNFRVPLIFRHPLLPRLQLNVNAASISILPTILDLLVNTDSLNKLDKEAASDLIHEYEGQSLVRPYKTTHNGRQAWNMGILNAGGTRLSVSSAAVPFRLSLPLRDDYTYSFTDAQEDPNELDFIEEWNIDSLAATIRRQHGDAAADWVIDAEQVGKWWVEERKRLWNYRE